MSTQSQREITIYATRGGKTEKITTDVTTWGELRPLVRKAGYDLSSLLAAESFTKHDLVNDLALLPVENFRLFLRPKQTKSGAEMSYKELRAGIKAILDGNDSAKDHFNVGKNYTTKGTEELRSLYNSYKGTKKASKSKPVKEVVNKVKKVVDSVKAKKSKKEGKKEKASKAVKEEVAKYDNPLMGIINSLKALPQTENIEDAIEILEEELEGEGTPKQESEEDILAREARAMGY